MGQYASLRSAEQPDRTRWVQQTLNRIDDAGLEVDGVWGRQTDQALRSFQARQGTEPNGDLGRSTLRAIERQGGTIAPAFSGADEEVGGQSQQCRIDLKNRRHVCGTVVADERRAPLKNADEGQLKEVPKRLRFGARVESLLEAPLQAYERMYDALHREVPGLNSSMLKLLSGYRGFASQARLFKIGILAEFKNGGCDTVPPGRLTWLIDRTNDAFRGQVPNFTDLQIWPNKFFQIAAANKIGFGCGVAGARQLISKRRALIAPPTSNSHQSGCSIDVWLGSGTSSKNRDQQIRMPAFKWMVGNAKRFGFHPYVTEPWHWEYIEGSASEAGGLGGIWSALLRPFGAVQSEAEGPGAPSGAAGIAGLVTGLGSIASNVAGAAFSSVEKLWLVSHAQSTGVRDRGKLTDAVFNRRHPERQGRRIDRNEPNATALIAEWHAIAEKVATPVLAYLSQAQGGAAASPAQPASGPILGLKLGTLPLYSKGRRAGQYQFRPEDLEWIAKLMVGESGGRGTTADRAVAQCVINRYAVAYHRRFKSFAAFLRAFSTTLQPVLTNSGAAKRHMNKPEFVRMGGFYAKAPDVPRGQLKRHVELQQKSWSALPEAARSVAVDALTGRMVNPGIGNADNFASTRIYFKDKYRREPDPQQWRAFTEAVGKGKGKWVGDVPGLDQKTNAFFLSNEAGLIGEAIKVSP